MSMREDRGGKRGIMTNREFKEQRRMPGQFSTVTATGSTSVVWLCV